MLSFEKQAAQEGFKFIVGIDEAGRGPLAGPVVACAVMLSDHHFDCVIRDSKKMSARQRALAYDEIFRKGYVGLGQSDHVRIDKENILQATFHAMNQAVQDLFTKIPHDGISDEEFLKKVCLLVDGSLFKTTLPCAYKTIIGGDSLSLSVACASIVAKVTRDRIMEDYDKLYPEYGFIKHKGYPTSFHKEKIKEHGFSPIHRKTFKYWK